MCNNCGEKKVKYQYFGATGWRYFCSEECWSVFYDMPIKEEGYYCLDKVEVGQ